MRWVKTRTRGWAPRQDPGPAELGGRGLEGDGRAGAGRGPEQTGTCTHSDANLSLPVAEFTPKDSLPSTGKEAWARYGPPPVLVGGGGHQGDRRATCPMGGV